MKVFLYSFESPIDNLYVTNDNMSHIVSGTTYYAAAIESKEVALDLKEIMGEVTITLPWEQSGFLQESIANPYDAAVELNIYTFDTGSEATTLVFKGFINSVKGSQCQLEASCVSFVEQARDNFPRMYVTRYCNHRLYSPLCTLSPTNWTSQGTITAISTNRLGFYVDGLGGSFVENWFRYGYVKTTVPHRWITYSSSPQSGKILFKVLHPIPPSWVVGTTVDCIAGCDKRMETCTNKFNNFSHYLGFPHAPYETIRLTGLKSTEVYTRSTGKK